MGKEKKRGDRHKERMQEKYIGIMYSQMVIIAK